MAWRLGRLWMSSYDPYAAYGHITAIPETLAEDPLSIIGFILLGITLLGSLIFDRFFCKYLCPAGAFYAIVGKISPTRIERNNDACVHCNLCTKACPVNLDVAKMDRVTSAECLNCNECVNACPKKGALEIKTFKKKISPLVMIALVAALFFIPLFATQVAGVYEVLPEQVKTGDTIALSEVKGYMSIADAAKAVGMPEDQFRAVMKIPENVPAATLMKGISEIVAGYDFDSAKEDATAILAPVSPAASVSPSSAPTSTGTVSPSGKVDASLVKGSMTISDAAAAVGLSGLADRAYQDAVDFSDLPVDHVQVLRHTGIFHFAKEQAEEIRAGLDIGQWLPEVMQKRGRVKRLE
jgi:NAD-dependent dihydropyrimidine dehydrogenase PreA subunit